MNFPAPPAKLSAEENCILHSVHSNVLNWFTFVLLLLCKNPLFFFFKVKLCPYLELDEELQGYKNATQFTQLTVFCFGGNKHSSLTTYMSFMIVSDLGMTLTFYPTDMEYLEALTEGLERVLMVRGTGQEVVTIYSWVTLEQWIRKMPNQHHTISSCVTPAHSSRLTTPHRHPLLLIKTESICRIFFGGGSNCQCLDPIDIELCSLDKSNVIDESRSRNTVWSSASSDHYIVSMYVTCMCDWRVHKMCTQSCTHCSMQQYVQYVVTS